MNPIADMVAEMLARGLPADVIVLAVRTAEQSTAQLVRGHSADKIDVAAERRRAADRERKAAVRRQSAEIPQKSADANSALSFLEKNTKEDEGKKKEKAVRQRGHKLSADWKLNNGHLAAGRQLGFTDAQVSEQAEDMRLWARSNEHRAVARKTDWDMTFLAWLRRNKPNGNTNGQRNRNSGRTNESDVLAGLARGFGVGDGVMAGPADADVPRGRFELDLEPETGGGAPRRDVA